MAYELLYKYLYPLFEDSGFSFLRLFQYITFRSAYAVVTSLILSFIIAPILIRWLKNKNIAQLIRDDGPKSHLSKSGTPTMGGLMILISIVVSVLFWGRLDFEFILVLILAAIFFGFIGFLDDYKKLIHKNSKGILVKQKLIWQGFVSLVIIFIISQINYIEKLNFHLPFELLNLLKQGERVPIDLINNSLKETNILPLYIPFVDKPIIDLNILSYSFYIPWFNMPIYLPCIYIIFGIFVIVGSSNSVNLTDGLDGLAIGLLIFVGIAFGILAYLSGNINVTQYLNIVFVKQAGELAVFCAAFVGAGMGFLWYNSHPAKIFMGDTGSLSLGGLIGILALMMKKELLLIIVGGVFVLEALSVIIQVVYFKWKRKRFFKMAPLHHHFELNGWPESKIIIRFWIIGGTLALIALSTIKIQ